jgi:hypothetical protein
MPGLQRIIGNQGSHGTGIHPAVGGGGNGFIGNRSIQMKHD